MRIFIFSQEQRLHEKAGGPGIHLWVDHPIHTDIPGSLQGGQRDLPLGVQLHPRYNV